MEINKPNVYKEVISVDFTCSHYARFSTIRKPELADYVISVNPITWSSLGDIRLPNDREPSDSLLINLRWFEAGSANAKLGGILTLPVEISYTSKALDRQNKLDELGV